MSGYDEVPLPGQEFAGPDLDEEHRFGMQCASLVESEAYGTVTAHMRAMCVEAFEATPLRDTEGLLYCRMMSKVLTDFDALLRDAVDTGHMAAQQLEAKRATFKGSQENEAA